MPLDDEAEAIALANGTDYGLLAAVSAENAGRLHGVAKAVKPRNGSWTRPSEPRCGVLARVEQGIRAACCPPA